MNAIETIMTRRSIRKFTDEPITDETLQKLLEAIRWAPSWANTQAVEVVVIRDNAAKEKIVEILSPNNPSTKGILQAPVVLVMCARIGRAGYKDGVEATDKGDWYMFDTGIACQNLALAAHALGLGTVHVGYVDHQALDTYLGLPEDVKSIEVMPIGYPARVGNAPPRRELSEFVFNEKYGEKL